MKNLFELKTTFGIKEEDILSIEKGVNNNGGCRNSYWNGEGTCLCNSHTPYREYDGVMLEGEFKGKVFLCKSGNAYIQEGRTLELLPFYDKKMYRVAKCLLHIGEAVGSKPAEIHETYKSTYIPSWDVVGLFDMREKAEEFAKLVDTMSYEELIVEKNRVKGLLV